MISGSVVRKVSTSASRLSVKTWATSIVYLSGFMVIFYSRRKQVCGR